MSPAFCGAALLFMGLIGSANAATPNFPTRPIQIVVPVAPGGNTDVATRLLASKMSNSLGQSIVVENRTGAGGAIGSDYVARSKPDGYTLLSASNGQLAVSPAVNPKLSYDPIRDFSPVGLVFRVPLALTVPISSPIQTVQQFIEASKTSKDGLTIGTSGNGGAQHLMVARLIGQTKARLIMVPYRGGNAILPDLVSGAIDGTLNELPNVIELHRSGRARIIALSADQRSPLLPDIPTFKEGSVPGYTAYSTNGWLAPSETPPEVVKVIRDALAQALKDNEVQKRFVEMGLMMVSQDETNPEVFARFIAEDLDQTRKVVNEFGISIQ